jgi:pseudouridine-5'-phosphate glycosidase
MMRISIPAFIRVTAEVARALDLGLPLVALESAVITHGLLPPDNLSIAMDMEQEIQSQGVVPATIGLIDGLVRVGLSPHELDQLANPQGEVIKVSARDISRGVHLQQTGGTTVAGTLSVMGRVGLRVMATGGIGGVHSFPRYDVSADLQQLARTPAIVVCSGAKSILDLPATLEVLETLSIPVIGFGTQELPAFYARQSGLQLPCSCQEPEEVASMAHIHWEMGSSSAVLVVVSPPLNVALPREEAAQAEAKALRLAKEEGVHGAALTPFLLRKVSELTQGRSVQANLGLLRNNARVAAAISRALSAQARKTSHI